jgi:hypothetical protein
MPPRWAAYIFTGSGYAESPGCANALSPQPGASAAHPATHCTQRSVQPSESAESQKIRVLAQVARQIGAASPTLGQSGNPGRAEGGARPDVSPPANGRPGLDRPASAGAGVWSMGGATAAGDAGVADGDREDGSDSGFNGPRNAALLAPAGDALGFAPGTAPGIRNFPRSANRAACALAGGAATAMQSKATGIKSRRMTPPRHAPLKEALTPPQTVRWARSLALVEAMASRAFLHSSSPQTESPEKLPPVARNAPPSMAMV